jgi:hypothetical protein
MSLQAALSRLLRGVTPLPRGARAAADALEALFRAAEAPEARASLASSHVAGELAPVLTAALHRFADDGSPAGQTAAGYAAGLVGLLAQEPAARPALTTAAAMEALTAALRAQRASAFACNLIMMGIGHCCSAPGAAVGELRHAAEAGAALVTASMRAHATGVDRAAVQRLCSRRC